MDPFSQWGIRRDVSGQRVRFVVDSDNGSVKSLRTKRDVVIFLSKNMHLNLTPEAFDFKMDPQTTLTQMPMDQDSTDKDFDQDTNERILDQDSNDINNLTVVGDSDDVQMKRMRLDDKIFGEKVEKVSVNNMINHEEEYENVLKQLHKIRVENSILPSGLSQKSVNELENIMSDLSIGDDPIQLVKKLCIDKELFAALKLVMNADIEAEIELNSLKDSKAVTMEFPVEQSSNFYCSVIKEAATKMPHLLSFIVNIVDSETEKLTPGYAIKIATLVCDILGSADKRHSALKKLNTLHMVFQKSSVGNLKTFGAKGTCNGHTEATRLVEDMAELSEFFKASKYSLDLGIQITMDNVDAVMNGKLEHWLLAFSRKDPINAQHLSNEKPTFEIKDLNYEVVYLNEVETEYLKKCSRVVLAKKLSDMNIGFGSILNHFPLL